MHRNTKENWSKRHHKQAQKYNKLNGEGLLDILPEEMTTDGQQEQWIGNQERGKRKEVDREEDVEMTSGFMQE